MSMTKFQSRMFILVAAIITMIIASVMLLFIFPPTLQYQLTYSETLTQEHLLDNTTPIVVGFCFSVPGGISKEPNLQQYFIEMTKENMKTLTMTEVTGINDFTYKTTQGCDSAAIEISKEMIEETWPLFLKGQLVPI